MTFDLRKERSTLKERVRKRLATIEATKDDGLYARHYAEDVKALLDALEDDEGVLDRLARMAGGHDPEDEPSDR